jgi:hypothetical protein
LAVEAIYADTNARKFRVQRPDEKCIKADIYAGDVIFARVNAKCKCNAHSDKKRGRRRAS